MGQNKTNACGDMSGVNEMKNSLHIVGTRNLHVDFRWLVSITFVITTETGTSLSPLWDEMKLSPVLYRFFDSFSLGLASGKRCSLSRLRRLCYWEKMIRFTSFSPASSPASYGPLVSMAVLVWFLWFLEWWFGWLCAWCDGWALDLLDWCSPTIWN